MATATERERLRQDVGANSTALSDADADDIYAEAAEMYTDSATINAYTRTIAIRRLLASSARLTSYKQNESSENLSDIFKHLKELLKVWEDKTTDAVAAGGSGAARFGSVRRKPARIKEYPEW